MANLSTPRGLHRGLVRMDLFNLRHARTSADLSQEDLAVKAGISQPGVISAEDGALVSIETATSIAAALGVPIDTLLIPQYRQQVALPEDPIPPQGAGPHFGISATGRIARTPPSALDSEGNDTARIEQLLPLVRQTAADLDKLLTPQVNAFPELARDIEQYRAAISETEPRISWGLIWGLGVRLDAMAAATGRRIANRLVPPLEDAVLAALQSLRTLHGALILSTAEGRTLQAQADRLRMTREEQAALRADAAILSQSLRHTEDIVEPDAAAIIGEAASAIGEGDHPERGTTFGIATIGHTSVVLIAAAVVAAPAHFIGGVLGAGLTMGAWEGMKKSPIFSAAAAALGVEFNRVIEAGGAAVRDAWVRLLPFKHFVRANEPQLRHIAADTQQLRWMLPYIDYIMQMSEPESLAQNS